MNIWQKLKKEKPEGFFALAPMADVTDNAFRRIVNELGRPDIFWTEFAAVDGLVSRKGRRKIKNKLLVFDKKQKPIIAQIFGGKPDNFKQAAKICRRLGFDGIDINMGCPQKNIVKQRAGVDLINDPRIAKEIFIQTKEGAGKLPVSVKTRLGFNKIDLDWAKEVLSWQPAAFTIHLRTKKEMSKVPAHWELMDDIKKMRNEISPDTVLIGNGDIENLEQGKEQFRKYGIDGVMIGRGIFNNPLLFTGQKFDWEPKKKLELAVKHAEYFGQEKEVRSFALMKKFFKMYINDYTGAKELRAKMMRANNLEELKEIYNDF